jgi:hypothetical protein
MYHTYHALQARSSGPEPACGSVQRHCLCLLAISGSAGWLLEAAWMSVVQKAGDGSPARRVRQHTGLVSELWTVLSPAPRTIKAPYDSYHYTLSPFHLALAREAPTPDAPVTPSPWGGTSLSSPPLLFSSISPQAIRTLNNPRMPRLHTCACCQGINAIRGA